MNKTSEEEWRLFCSWKDFQGEKEDKQSLESVRNLQNLPHISNSSSAGKSCQQTSPKSQQQMHQLANNCRDRMMEKNSKVKGTLRIGPFNHTLPIGPFRRTLPIGPFNRTLPIGNLLAGSSLACKAGRPLFYSYSSVVSGQKKASHIHGKRFPALEGKAAPKTNKEKKDSKGSVGHEGLFIGDYFPTEIPLKKWETLMLKQMEETRVFGHFKGPLSPVEQQVTKNIETSKRNCKKVGHYRLFP